MAKSITSIYDKYVAFSKSPNKIKEVDEEEDKYVISKTNSKAVEMNEFALESKLRKHCHDLLDDSITKSNMVMIETTNQAKLLNEKVLNIEKVLNKTKKENVLKDVSTKLCENEVHQQKINVELSDEIKNFKEYFDELNKFKLETQHLISQIAFLK